MSIYDLKIIEDPLMMVVRHHRKKRIRNKWKKQGYPKHIDPNYYMKGDKIICHPSRARKLYELINKVKED